MPDGLFEVQKLSQGDLFHSYQAGYSDGYEAAKVEILTAVRKELESTNKIMGIEKFSDNDYTCIGVVSCAIKNHLNNPPK